MAYRMLRKSGNFNLLLFSLDIGYFSFFIYKPNTGDIVAFLPGMCYPVLLRPYCTQGEYSLVGFVWVLGVMDDKMEYLDTFRKIQITIL